MEASFKLLPRVEKVRKCEGRREVAAGVATSLTAKRRDRVVGSVELSWTVTEAPASGSSRSFSSVRSCGREDVGGEGSVSSGLGAALLALALARPANGPVLADVVAALIEACAVLLLTEAVGGLDKRIERRGDSKVAGADAWSLWARAGTWLAEAARR